MGFGRAKEDRPTPPEVYNWRIYAIAFSATIGSYMFGYNSSVIAGVMVLPSFTSEFNLPSSTSPGYTNIAANIVSLLQIGAIVGSLMVFPVLKSLGRKMALGLSGAIYFVGAALQVRTVLGFSMTTASNPQTFSAGKLGIFYAGRILAGFGLGFTTVAIPMYIGELSPPAIRGSLIGLYEINNQLASCWGYWSNYFVYVGVPATQSRQWQIPLAVQMIPGGLLCLASVVLPESPRWLIEHGRSDQARRVLAFVRHLSPEHEYVCYEMDRVEEATARQHSLRAKQTRWQLLGQLLRELTWPGNRNRLAIGCFLMWASNMTGTVGISSYAPSIFESIGMHGTRLHLELSGFYAVSRTCVTILGLVFFIDKFGRRKLLITASIGIIATLMYIGAYNTVTVNDTDKGAGGIVSLVAVFAFAVSFGVGWNGVPWVYCAEIFPARIKDMAVCITTWNQWLAQFLTTRLTPYMLAATASGNVLFFVFGSMTFCSLLIVYFFLPETKGRILEDMDEVFGTPYKDQTVQQLANPMVEELVKVPTNV